MSEKLWGGRFAKMTDEMINEFQASIGFDRRMYREDIAGSIAHAAMLAHGHPLRGGSCGHRKGAA